MDLNESIIKAETPKRDLEEAFSNLFKTSVSGSGEEELLKVAAKYSLQLSAKQIRLLCAIKRIARKYSVDYPQITAQLQEFLDYYIELKQYNNSAVIVMKGLEYIALRKFFNEQTFRVNIDK